MAVSLSLPGSERIGEFRSEWSDSCYERPTRCLCVDLSILDICPDFRVVRHASEDSNVQGPIQTSITTTVEPVADGIARRRRDGTDACRSGERRFGPHFLGKARLT